MKIVITVSEITPGGGLSKYICTLADILTQDTNNQVYVITTHASDANPQLEQLKTERNVQYISLGGISTIKRYLKLIFQLRKLSPDIVINNYNATTQYILPFLRRKTKIIHILHNNTNDFYRVAAINGKCVDKWIAPTPALEEYFNAFTRCKYQTRVITIPHAVDGRRAGDKPVNKIIQLTFVGVLYTHKGVLILPEIIKRLVAAGYKFHFTFIGDGILRLDLEESLKNEINLGVVEFTGRVDGNEVYRRLQLTDIFVYPTHIDAFGLVIAEAMINGAIPVVTCLKGITDTIVDEGVNGYLVAQDDINCFVERISYLIDNQDVRMKMMKSSIAKAEKCFSKNVMEKQYMNVLTSL